MKLQLQSQAIASLDLACAALEAGHAAEALKHIAQSLRLDPGSVAARFTEACIHQRLNQPAKALTALDAINLYDPAFHRRLDVTLLRAECLIAAGRDESAVPLLEQLIDLCPQDARLHRIIAGIHRRLGNEERAIEHLRQVVVLEPRDSASARVLAGLLAGSQPQAAAALTLASDAAAPIRWRATRLLCDAGRDADAEENYRALLPDALDDAAVWMEAGELADRCGAFDVAVKRFTHAINLPGPHRVDAMSVLAQAAMHAGKFSVAAWWWLKATRIDATNATAWAAMSICGLCAGRPHLADIAQARLLRTVEGDEATLLLSEAWMHASTGDVIQRATRPAADVAPTASPLTWILRRSADVLAEQAARKPGWADTLYHTAMCRAALGDDDEARDAVQAALDINPNYKAATTLAASLPKAA